MKSGLDKIASIDWVALKKAYTDMDELNCVMNDFRYTLSLDVKRCKALVSDM
jgi:hypothetical protein